MLKIKQVLSKLNFSKKGKIIREYNNGQKKLIDFGKDIGTFINAITDEKILTSIGLVCVNKYDNTFHVIPSQPSKYKDSCYLPDIQNIIDSSISLDDASHKIREQLISSTSVVLNRCMESEETNINSVYGKFGDTGLLSTVFFILKENISEAQIQEEICNISSELVADLVPKEWKEIFLFEDLSSGDSEVLKNAVHLWGEKIDDVRLKFLYINE